MTRPPRRSRFPRPALPAVLLGTLACVGSCAAPARLFVNDQADMSYYTRVAVLPFENLSGDRFAGARVTRAFITELVISGRYQIVEPEEYRVALAAIGGEPNVQGQYDMAKLQEGARRVQATGILRGAVTEYAMIRAGSEQVPAVGFDVELVDAATGQIVWRLSASKKGRGRLPLVGGPNTRTLTSVTQEACMDAVARLQREAF